MKIKIAVIFFLAGMLGACNGWPRAPQFDEARDKPEKYPTYAMTPLEPAPFAFSGRHWVISPATFEMTGARLEPIGTAGGTRIFAAQGASAPYTILYAPVGGTKWRRVLPID
jgi:hypothetical protein